MENGIRLMTYDITGTYAADTPDLFVGVLWWSHWTSVGWFAEVKGAFRCARESGSSPSVLTTLAG